MKVLFISSGRAGRPGDVVKNQGESLKAAGIVIDYFLINPGFLGYLMAIPKLRHTFKKGNYDLAHAHYSLCGFVAVLAGCKPLVVSLMGSDVYISGLFRTLTRLFIKYKWTETIVKTGKMKELIGINRVQVIPNGVDIERFRPIPKEIAREHIGYKENKKLIVFIAVKNREEKNLNLAMDAIRHLDDNTIDFKHIHDVPNWEIPYYLNAADLLLLTSRREGSVNVIKEAMACNCPIVSTDVGDVRWVIGDTEGCYISSFEPEVFSESIKKAINFGKRTNGRQRIIDLGLDSDSIARKIIALYEEVLSK
jgi:glycosyltransferase involved in cell wall biosynthesis